ncbi:MAG: transcriptional repressor NrdR [Clostridiales bacterium]|jgi:transcriptional repressor NrdR|nr:transcriptional repressor NrdR [Clostridiales bacterium]HOB64330.1 transcriptional regulator NrdR [Clostridia bacterium]HOK81539.1 transcriptional regulator NrdR [Clostridia bacterium]HOL60985.1 transcriptional regulator NrdR [Clostridia bacterium]HPO53423.1 transcriptional regulator NrdR [Clostridia bacterium]
MKCPFCGSIDSKVIDSRLNEDGTSIRRRRECISCLKRYTTYEKIEYTPILVVKSNGNRQIFDPAKIKNGILKACEKRPVPIAKVDKLVADIEKQVNNSLAQEISSKKIGEMVMDGLKTLDDVAYVRFASVHRQFKDINTLKEEIERLIGNKKDE